METISTPVTVGGGAAASPASPAALWAMLAQRCLSLTLRFDYLSTARGHRQSHRPLQERRARAAVAITRHDGKKLVRPETTSSGDAEVRYLAEVAERARLTSREEYCVVTRMQAGDRGAYDALIEANLGLVVMIARQYQRPGVTLLDLIAEGNMGLMRAADRFDAERGCRFATYAKWWVLQSIQQAMPKLASVVRIPLSQARAGVRAQTLHGEGDAGEVAMHLVQEIDDEAPDHADAVHGVEARRRTEWQSAPHEIVDAGELDMIAIDPEEEPPASVMAAQRRQVLQRALCTLRERERMVIGARFALEDGRVSTLDELATRLKVSIERVRQIESAAVKSLEKALRRDGQSAQTML